MNKLDLDYQNLLKDILENGVKKETRNGGTLSVFGRQIRHKMSDGFPALTTKKFAFKTMVTELLWFLRGSTRGDELTKQGCHIWDGDVYKNYVAKVNMQPGVSMGDFLEMKEFINKIKTDDEFAKKWGDLGPIYGKQWRGWGSEVPFGEATSTLDEGVDQIQNLINELKTNPDSRRLLVSAWNPTDLPDQVLPPCHYGFQVYTRELSPIEIVEQAKKDGLWKEEIPEGVTLSELQKDFKTRAISLMFNMRSNDVPLGLPFNIASYGLLLEIFGKIVNMVPDELIASLGDAHIYNNQVDGVKEQLTRTPMKLPNLIISDDVNFNGTIDDFLDSCTRNNFKLDGYESHPSIKMPLSN